MNIIKIKYTNGNLDYFMVDKVRGADGFPDIISYINKSFYEKSPLIIEKDSKINIINLANVLFIEVGE